MDTLTYPLDGDRDRGSAVIAVYWITSIVGVLITSLRFFSRISIHAVGWDDWTMLLAVLLMLATTILGTVLCLHGGCRHLYFLVLDGRYPTVTRLMHLALPFNFMTLATARISVAILILRIITRSKWRRRFLYSLIVVSAIANLVWCILWFAKCPPGTSLSGPYVAGLTWNPIVFYGYTAFTASWNVFMDFVLALLPITVFWNLQLRLKKRVSLCILTGCGLLAAICGAVKTAKLSEISRVDFTWEEFDLYIWSAAETVLIVVCGCIPTLKPIYDKFIKPRRSLKGWYAAYRYKRPFRSQSFFPNKSHHQSPPNGFENVERPPPTYFVKSNQARQATEMWLWSNGGSQMDAVSSHGRNADTEWTPEYGLRS